MPCLSISQATLGRGRICRYLPAAFLPERQGRRVETADAWIAATALLYDCPLLTHNKPDYLGMAALQSGDA
jgi:hypothetical protein